MTKHPAIPTEAERQLQGRINRLLLEKHEARRIKKELGPAAALSHLRIAAREGQGRKRDVASLAAVYLALIEGREIVDELNPYIVDRELVVEVRDWESLLRARIALEDAVPGPSGLAPFPPEYREAFGRSAYLADHLMGPSPLSQDDALRVITLLTDQTPRAAWEMLNRVLLPGKLGKRPRS